jgi:hypothetical protein
MRIQSAKINGFGLGEGGDFHYKYVCGALNGHFCQTSLSTSPFFSVVFVRCHFVSVLVPWFGGSFAVFYFVCLEKL